MRTMFYAKSTNGFYDPVIHGDVMPSDAVEVTKEQYDALFEGQAQGNRITGDDEGNPVLIAPQESNLEPKPNLVAIVNQQQELIAQLTTRLAALENKQ